MTSRQGRAAVLINRIVAAGEMPVADLMRVLHVSREAFESYRSGAEPMPLNVQARLALYVIGALPAFAREGNLLRHQVAAAISMQSHGSSTSRTGKLQVATPDAGP
ncbi:MAG TPA: hypothetical protein VEB19_05445 [Gemmatimonadaceae bacterium]|nr:hypothetical protein [Gemmatimonadaceae bacterium]